MNRPEIVEPQQWQAARKDLLVAEKEATRVLDALAARRRRLPMTPFPATGHEFTAPDGPRTLLDLFGPHRQLVTYQFMDRGPDAYCSGCTWFTDNVPAHAPQLLAENDVSWVTVTDMPLDQFAAYRERKGWTMPFVSSRGTSFSADTGAGQGFLLSVWLRGDGGTVFRTYRTTSRGIDRHAFVTGLLDLTPFGRGETWEDSPEGWPQQPAMRETGTLTPDGVATGYGRWR